MKLITITLVAIGVLLIAYLAAYLCCYVVQENEVVILTEFGKTVDVKKEPGLYYKKPGFIQTVNRLDKRLHLFKSQPSTITLHDKNPIIVSCLICWKIDEPELFFRRVRSIENASTKIGDMIYNQLGSVLGTYDLDNLINIEPGMVKLDEIETKVLDNTNRSAKEQYGIVIKRVGIRRLAYPAIVERSVYSRMRAEREKEAKKYRAEGREESDKIESESDKEVKRIMADAYRDAQIAKGKGDNEAMRIYAEAYGKDTEFYEFLKSLEIYKQTLRENSTLILSTDSELFKHLNYKGNARGAGDAKAPTASGGSSDDG